MIAVTIIIHLTTAVGLVGDVTNRAVAKGFLLKKDSTVIQIFDCSEK